MSWTKREPDTWDREDGAYAGKNHIKKRYRLFIGYGPFVCAKCKGHRRDGFGTIKQAQNWVDDTFPLGKEEEWRCFCGPLAEKD